MSCLPNTFILSLHRVGMLAHVRTWLGQHEAPHRHEQKTYRVTCVAAAMVVWITDEAASQLKDGGDD